MNGYEYLVRRNRLIMELEDALAKLKDLPAEERSRHTARLQMEFDRKLATTYEQVASEYPGERCVKARPIQDPR